MASTKGNAYSSYRKDSGDSVSVMLGYQPQDAAKVYSGYWVTVSKGEQEGWNHYVELSSPKCIRAIMKTKDGSEFISKWRCP
ncbi:hypothetical protein [Streptomyces sp. GbtcB6]|uniref:hypothetical protein n=1 Tax=Streptomyces sp. GbtcB6 TaxID=2824751 RepID=UPI001C2FC749|nr:hypothetical protein [Streptomyces sp. GbtcB6]